MQIVILSNVRAFMRFVHIIQEGGLACVEPFGLKHSNVCDNVNND